MFFSSLGPLVLFSCFFICVIILTVHWTWIRFLFSSLQSVKLLASHCETDLMQHLGGLSKSALGRRARSPLLRHCHSKVSMGCPKRFPTPLSDGRLDPSSTFQLCCSRQQLQSLLSPVTLLAAGLLWV